MTLDTNSPDFVKLFLTTVGYAISVLSLVYKVPQIINIVSAGSAEGVSLQSYIIETFGFTVTFAYHNRNEYPLSAYGETITILFQNLLVVLLIIFYSKKMIHCATAIIMFTAWMYYILFVGSMDLLTLLQSSSVLILISSKVPQIYTIYKNKSAGTLAIPTLLMGTGGAAARILTTLKLVQDPTVLFGYCLSFLLNGAIFAQAVYYRYVSPSAKVEKEIKNKNTQRKQKSKKDD